MVPQKIIIKDICRGCFSKNLVEVLDLGQMPLAGGFLKDKLAIKKEAKYPLKLHLCKDCKLLQVLTVIPPKILFKDYHYQSSIIPALKQHFVDYASFLKGKYLTPNSRLLEFGCNDGPLLEEFKQNSTISTLGVDPAPNIVKIAKSKNLNIINGFFDTKLLKKIDATQKYDVITGSNVFAHTDNIHEILKTAEKLLSPDGVFIIEVYDGLELLRTFQYDTIYHEHLTYYSLTALEKIYSIAGYKIIEVIRLPMHGGALRVIASLIGSKKHTKANLSAETLKEKKLLSQKNITKFQTFCLAHKQNLFDKLQQIKNKGGKIVGYGAPGRGTILLNYCQLDNKIIDYLVDLSPLRHGHLMPGVHIPIKPIEVLRADPSITHILILAWNYTESILKQETKLLQKGVKFIKPMPKIGYVK